MGRSLRATDRVRRSSPSSWAAAVLKRTAEERSRASATHRPCAHRCHLLTPRLGTTRARCRTAHSSAEAPDASQPSQAYVPSTRPVTRRIPIMRPARTTTRSQSDVEPSGYSDLGSRQDWHESGAWAPQRSTGRAEGHGRGLHGGMPIDDVAHQRPPGELRQPTPHRLAATSAPGAARRGELR
jgi:hypothetical protein